ncbi:MAG TPA: DUF5906 domain-containing protein [Pirellulales bacterium]
MTIRQSIKAFLLAYGVKPLAELYSEAMECQVNIDRTKGEPDGRGFKDSSGKKFWPIRIPHDARSNPHWRDYDGYSLTDFADKIGMTGWDFENVCSRWVAFDFDELTGTAHIGSGISADEIKRLREKLELVPWVQIQRSTSGGEGLHVYVFFDTPVSTANHTEHADLGRYVLGLLSKECGCDLSDPADVVGGNFWVWSKNQNEHSFERLKERTGSPVIPDNWRDSLPPRAAREVTPVTAGAGHHKLVDWLIANGFTAVYDHDEKRLRTHTAALKVAHELLGLPGVFETVATGRNKADHNCFAYPRLNGSWYVVRYGENVTEGETWHKTKSGLPACVLTFRIGWDEATAKLGLLCKKGAYFVPSFDVLSKLLNLVGMSFELPAVKPRGLWIRKQSNGTVSIEMDHGQDDPNEIPGWFRLNKCRWGCAVGEWNELEVSENVTEAFAEVIRRTKANDEGDGWFIVDMHDGKWVHVNRSDVIDRLATLGVPFQRASAILGSLPFWTIVNIPCGDEYPAERQWNPHAAQFAFPIASQPGETPTWDKVLNHCGQGFDDAVLADEWCQENGIVTGAQYLRLYVAATLFRFDLRVPYLVLYSPKEDTGKSTFFYALRLLFTKGFVDLANALTNPQGFNGELAGAVFGYVEDTDLSSVGKQARSRLRRWVTDKVISIHAKGGTPYTLDHFMRAGQSCNETSEAPIFDGDTRCMVAEVQPLTQAERMDTQNLESALKAEASSFLYAMQELSKRLPPSKQRLYPPVIETAAKRDAARSHRTEIKDKYAAVFDAVVTLADNGKLDEPAERDELNELVRSIDPHCEVPGTSEGWAACFKNIEAHLDDGGYDVTHFKRNKDAHSPARWQVVPKSRLAAMDCMNGYRQSDGQLTAFDGGQAA